MFLACYGDVRSPLYQRSYHFRESLENLFIVFWQMYEMNTTGILLNERKRSWGRNRELLIYLLMLFLFVSVLDTECRHLGLQCVALSLDSEQVGHWKHLITDKYKLSFLISSIV